jgi:hypothetical protein
LRIVNPSRRFEGNLHIFWPILPDVVRSLAGGLHSGHNVIAGMGHDCDHPAMRTPSQRPAKRVLILAPAPAQLLDLAGPAEVFGERCAARSFGTSASRRAPVANRFSGPSRHTAAVHASGGLHA